jgi:vanillate O-demethylase ferredoxin subunit
MTILKNPPFKMLIVGRRRSDTTIAQHRHHIREIHGKIVLSLIGTNPDHAPRRYVQNQVIDGSWRTGGVTNDPFALGRDFLTQVWFDSPVQAMQALSHPLYITNLQPDEDNFVDQSSVVKLAAKEHLVIAPSPTNGNFKVFAFFTKTDSTSADDFSKSWMQLGKKFATTDPTGNIQQYVQNQITAKPGETPMIDGVDEFWVKDLVTAHKLVTALQLYIAAPLKDAGHMGPDMAFYLIAEEAVLFAGASATN